MSIVLKLKNFVLECCIELQGGVQGPQYREHLSFFQATQLLLSLPMFEDLPHVLSKKLHPERKPYEADPHLSPGLSGAEVMGIPDSATTRREMLMSSLVLDLCWRWSYCSGLVCQEQRLWESLFDSHFGQYTLKYTHSTRVP